MNFWGPNRFSAKKKGVAPYQATTRGDPGHINMVYEVQIKRVCHQVSFFALKMSFFLM